DSQIPLIQMSDNNPTGEAESHFRNVRLVDRKDNSRRALVDRGGGARTAPITEHGVPVYLHDWFGPGRTAKVVSTASGDLVVPGPAWRKEPPLTGAESVVAEVPDLPFPQLLDPVDDLAPTTVITGTRLRDGKLLVTGVTHDNGEIASVTVNGQLAQIVSTSAGVADWQITIDTPPAGKVVASAKDRTGNVERNAHEITIGGQPRQVVEK
ncbi:MAG: hypothetical protein ABI883_09090, partial [Chthoniobacterales bacterium]